MAHRRMFIICFILPLLFNPVFLVEVSVSSRDEDRVLVTGNEGGSGEFKGMFSFEPGRHSVESQNSESALKEKGDYKTLTGDDEQVDQVKEIQRKPEDDFSQDADLKGVSKSSASGAYVHTPDDEGKDGAKTTAVDGDHSIMTGRKDVYHYGNTSPKSRSTKAQNGESREEVTKKKATMSTWEKAQLMMKKRNQNKMKKETRQLNKELVPDQLSSSSDLEDKAPSSSGREETTNKKGESVVSGGGKDFNAISDPEAGRSDDKEDGPVDVDKKEQHLISDEIRNEPPLGGSKSEINDGNSEQNKEVNESATKIRDEKKISVDDKLFVEEFTENVTSTDSKEDVYIEKDDKNVSESSDLIKEDGKDVTSETTNDGPVGEDSDGKVTAGSTNSLEYIYPDDGLPSDESAMEHVYQDEGEDDHPTNVREVEERNVSEMFADGIEDAYEEEEEEEEEEVVDGNEAIVGEDDEEVGKRRENVNGNDIENDKLVQNDGDKKISADILDDADVVDGIKIVKNDAVNDSESLVENKQPKDVSKEDIENVAETIDTDDHKVNESSEQSKTDDKDIEDVEDDQDKMDASNEAIEEKMIDQEGEPDSVEKDSEEHTRNLTDTDNVTESENVLSVVEQKDKSEEDGSMTPDVEEDAGISVSDPGQLTEMASNESDASNEESEETTGLEKVKTLEAEDLKDAGENNTFSDGGVGIEVDVDALSGNDSGEFDRAVEMKDLTEDDDAPSAATGEATKNRIIDDFPEKGDDNLNGTNINDYDDDEVEEEKEEDDDKEEKAEQPNKSNEDHDDGIKDADKDAKDAETMDLDDEFVGEGDDEGEIKDKVDEETVETIEVKKREQKIDSEMKDEHENAENKVDVPLPLEIEAAEADEILEEKEGKEQIVPKVQDDSRDKVAEDDDLKIGDANVPLVMFEDAPTYIESNLDGEERGDVLVPEYHSLDHENKVGINGDDNDDDAARNSVEDDEPDKVSESNLPGGTEEGDVREETKFAPEGDHVGSDRQLRAEAAKVESEEDAKVSDEDQEEEADASESTCSEKGAVSGDVEAGVEESKDDFRNARRNDSRIEGSGLGSDESVADQEERTIATGDELEKNPNEDSSEQEFIGEEVQSNQPVMDEIQDDRGSVGREAYTVKKEEEEKDMTKDEGGAKDEVKIEITEEDGDDKELKAETAEITSSNDDDDGAYVQTKMTGGGFEDEGLIDEEVEEFFLDAARQTTDGEWKLLSMRSYTNVFRTTIKKMDPFITEIIFMLPPSLQSLFLRAPFNMYPTHAFLLFVLSNLSLLLIFIGTIFKDDSQKKSKELKEMLFEASEVLLLRQLEKDEVLKNLEDVRAKLKQKEISLENGTVEMNKSLKAIIKECDSLKKEALEKMEAKKETRNEMKKVEADINKLATTNKEFQASISSSKEEIKQLQDRRNELQSMIDKSESNSTELEKEIRSLDRELEALKESRDQVISEVKVKDKEMKELQENVKALKTKCNQRSDLVREKETENKALRRAILQLKVMQAFLEKKSHVEGDNVDGDIAVVGQMGGDVEEEEEEGIKRLIDVTQRRIEVEEVEKEVSSLRKSLSQLTEGRINMEEELKRLAKEREKLVTMKEAAEQQTITSTTKSDVLSSYYEDRLKEYKSMIQEMEAKERAKTSQMKSADVKYKEVERSVEDYKNRVESLKAELENLHVFYKKQIDAQEKRLHENMASNRQIEREYELKKCEAAMIRERLLQLKVKIAHLKSKSSLKKSSESLDNSVNLEDVRPSSRTFLQKDGMPCPPEFVPPSFLPFMSRFPARPQPLPAMVPSFLPRAREDTPPLPTFRDRLPKDHLDERDRSHRNKVTPPPHSSVAARNDPSAQNVDSRHFERGNGSHRTMNNHK